MVSFWVLRRAIFAEIMLLSLNLFLFCCYRIQQCLWIEEDSLRISIVPILASVSIALGKAEDVLISKESLSDSVSL